MSTFEAIDEVLPLTVLSASAISTLYTCPEQFRRSKMLKEPKPPGGYGIVGTAFHVARRRALTAKLHGQEEPGPDRMLAWFRAAWTDAAAQPGVRWDGEPAKLREQGERMTVAYAETLAPRVHPVAVEEPFKGWIEGVPVPIFGRIDCIEQDETILDTKTGKQGAKQPKSGWLVQGLVYMALTGLSFRWHVISSAATPGLFAPEEHPALYLQARPSRIETGERIIRDAYGMLTNLLATRGLDREWPGTGIASGACKFCSFQSSCTYVP